MPQMAPLNWLSLMILFITIMTMFNMTNYFSFNQNLIKTKALDLEKKKINWKW